MKRRNWLIDLRCSKGLTQEKAAKLAGVERSTYTKAENGSSIAVKTAKKIAVALECDWTLFFESKCDKIGQKTA
ncbi:DNA-binding XRE family transcriptional regulator [Brevibacillus sp. AG162]|uniref:helix-turn-helix transcriptional regulator n=1 Tax=Brevibacillus sp. AG162 TaxID=2572910 RepID=UPI00114E4707|nr:helix-turn-helix transcriptional regulator [Brevibacillus sp. AG162]TQK74933.1 DNA-binding XRE family transcriptional regulator [Brevibacillus sp. AG162]